jgi:hypothetical protein
MTLAPIVDIGLCRTSSGITHRQVIWIHTLHVATGVYDFFFTIQGTIQLDLHLQSMHCHHYGSHPGHAYASNHAIALSMARTSPVYAAIGLWLLMSSQDVWFD